MKTKISDLIWSGIRKKSVWYVDISTDDLNSVWGDGSEMIFYWYFTNFSKVFWFEGHNDEISSVKFKRNKKLAASVGDDDKFSIWDLENMIIYAIFRIDNSSFCKIAISNDDENIALGGYESGICVWNITTKKQMFLFKNLNEAKRWLEIIKALKLI